MLATRIATALVLMAILLPAIFLFPPVVWGGVSLLFLAVGAREWVTLLDRAPQALGTALVVVVVGAVFLFWRAHGGESRSVTLAWSGILTAFWCVGGGLRLARGDARGGGVALATVVLLGCWAAMYELRQLGIVPLLSSMAVVWLADIAAYFVGRAVGRRKLAPRISPGKSWEGAIGGAVCVAVAGLAVAPALKDSLPAVLVAALSVAGAAIVLVALAALSVVGDLHESLLKRQAGAKDSGTILPGHGGVLDRVDALVPVMPAALLLYLLLG